MARKISIIIPSYNSARLLPQAVESALRSSFPDFEIIIVDDGSTDRTDELVGKNWQREEIRYIRQNNKGLAGARNTGIRTAQGEYLVFLDADDIILPDKLAVQKKYMDEHPGTDVVYSGSQWFVEDDVDDTRPVEFPVYEGNVLEHLLFGNFIHVNSVMVRRQKALDAGLFDESLRELEDWDLWLRMALGGATFGFTPGILSKVRIRKGSMTSNQQRMNATMVKVLEKTAETVALTYPAGGAIQVKTFHALALYKLKAGQTRGYLPFLFGTARRQGRAFIAIAARQTVKYFLNPFLKHNKTTAEIEKIWKS